MQAGCNRRATQFRSCGIAEGAPFVYIETEYQDKWHAGATKTMKRTTAQPAPLSTFSARHGVLEVVEVDDPDTEHKRMCELGICPGRRVQVVRKGNPSIVSIGESRFALSLELLSRVYVRPLK